MRSAEPASAPRAHAPLDALAQDAPGLSVQPQTPPRLDAAERARLLAARGHADPATATVPRPEACLHTLFEAQARRTPLSPAVSFGDTRLTYAELDARATRCARQLARRGVGPGERVALAVRRSVDMVVGLLGILKAGAAYVPIDCQHPPQRIVHLLSRSQPCLLLTHMAAHADLPPTAPSLPRLCLDTGLDEVQAQAGAMVPRAPTPDDLAYVIFTSGSTGEPKGVEISHRALVNHALCMCEHYALGGNDRALCSASIAFDVAAEQIYPALLCGAEVVVRPDDLLESFTRFDRFVREQGITALTLPTAFWHEWVHDLDTRGLSVPGSLRVLAVGTEKAFGDALACWRARGGQGARFLQGYGPTEATITCTMYVHDESAPPDPSAPLPIGWPLANTELYLLDEHLEPVPVGQPGEIHIGGVCLARGYLGRPDLTAERFIPHPFRSDPRARLYKTGDLGRFGQDGQLFFIGRRDFQIKLRGFRMEPAEIEAVLRGQPGVQACLVMLREDTPGLPQLTAYLAAPSGVDEAALRQRCREQLPEPMRPSAWVVLPVFPLNANGKVDRAALPAPAQPSAAHPPEPPHDPLQQAVAAVFAEVLGRPAVGLHDNFFELGGDSLRAVRMLSRLQARFATELSLQVLLRAPTVAGLACRLAPGGGNMAGPPDEAVVIELKPGTGTPIVLVAGCPIYRPLAHAFPGPNPVLALLMPAEEALLRRDAALPSLRELAVRYLAALRAHAPQGPYVLAGLSFGGMVAYEMSQCLAAEGAPVPLLVMFDSVLPSARRRDPTAWALKKLRHAWTRLRCAAGTGGTRDQEALAQAEMDELRHRKIGHLLAEYDQQIRPYTGQTLLYRAREARQRVTPGHGFRGLVAGLLECEVPGDHLGMLGEMHAPGLAADLARRVREIDLLARPAPAQQEDIAA